MQNKHTPINLGEIPDTCFFQKLDDRWVHFRRLADEQEEASQDYCWIKGHFLDAVEYKELLPSTPIIRSDLEDAKRVFIQHVPFRISAGKKKGKQNEHCERMLDWISMLLRNWFYMLKGGGNSSTWAEGRLVDLTAPSRLSPLTLPNSFQSLQERSQKKIPIYTPHKSTADFNKLARMMGASLKQPNIRDGELMDWEKPLFTLINLLTKAYFYASRIRKGITEFGHDVRERLKNESSGKRKTAYQFSSETIKTKIVGEDGEYNLTIDEKIKLAHVTAINPADFILPDECRRYHYELLILASKATDGKPVKQITENAVRLLMKWHDDIPNDDAEDDIMFLTEISCLLFRRPLPDKIVSEHIRMIAALLNIPGLWQYLRLQTAAHD